MVGTACATAPERAATPSTSAVTSTQSTSTTATTPSIARQIEEWKARAGDHFTVSGKALEDISRSSAVGDEAGLWSGCQQLHDTNSIGLQEDLPTPDRMLTAELQQMIDDMNSAAHACLRFVLARNPVEADVYQNYLARAIDHLLRAKVILSTLEDK